VCNLNNVMCVIVYIFIYINVAFLPGTDNLVQGAPFVE
jgi:hypothetical protein